MKRKQFMKELSDDEIPNVVALGRQIVDQGGSAEQQKARQRFSEQSQVPLKDPLKQARSKD